MGAVGGGSPTPRGDVVWGKRPFWVPRHAEVGAVVELLRLAGGEVPLAVRGASG